MPKNIADNEIFVTYDVTSLYSNIAHDLGIEAISFWLDKHPELLGRFSRNFVIDGLLLVLNNNYFEFNSQYYLQQIGTAMGTIMAPCYTSLTLGYLEEILYSRLTATFNSLIMNTIKNNYYRYLDDIFCIWDENLGDKSILHNILQSLHSSISFTCYNFANNVNFLDINVYKEDNIICTDIYY